jgi:hypothetical protein
MKASDAISFGSLIVNIIATMIFPLVLIPFIEYSATDPVMVPHTENVSESKIKIHNYGLAPANHVIGAMKGENITFFNFTSEPFLSKDFNYSTVKDWGFFKLEILPPASETDIIAKMNIPDAATKIPITFVRSDETVGKTDLIKTLTIVGYIVYLIGASLVFVYIFRMKF